MPRRMGTLTKAWAYRYIALRDGETCRNCGKRPEETREGYLEIDHIDEDLTNNAPSNLQLLCHAHNVAKQNRARATRRRVTPDTIPTIPKSERVREREREPDQQPLGTEIARRVIDYQAGGPEMRANGRYEVPFRTWVLWTVANREFLLVEEAVNAGAETVGCSTIVASRYLAKLTSTAGPLQETRDLLGAKVLTYKEGEQDAERRR